MDNQAATFRHDAFISYSRADVAFAKTIEAALERFRPARDIQVPQRHLDIFRDEADFTGAAYYDAVERHLQESATLIVICSPDAARSRYVDDEIRRFVGSDPDRANKIIPLLYRGIPNNEIQAGQEDERAFPAVLCEYLETPLGIHYLGFDTRRHKASRGAYTLSWYALLAGIYGISRSEIEARDRRRQAQRRRVQVGVAGTVILALSIALVVALFARQEAIRQTRAAEAQRDIATRRQRLADAARLSLTSLNQLSIDPQSGLLLAVEAGLLSAAASGTPSVEAQDALHRAFSASRERLTLTGHIGTVTALAFSPDRRLLATGDRTGIRLWDMVNGLQLTTRFVGLGSVLGLAFSPDGRTLATAERLRTIRLWDVRSGREQRSLPGHDAGAWSVAFSPDGRRLAAAGRDHTAKVWDLTSGREITTFTRHTGEVAAVSFSPDGSLVATGGADGVARIWEPATGRQLHAFTIGSTVRGVAFSPDMKQLAIVAFGGTAIWDMVSGREQRKLGAAASAMFALAYSPEGSRLATAGLDKTARLWDLSSGTESFAFRGHADGIISLTFSGDGKYLATGSMDGTARVWDVEEPYELQPLVGHTGLINRVAFSPDGARIATASSDGTARVWDPTTGLELFVMTHNGSVNDLTFSPDGTRLATGSSDGTAKVFDAVSGAELFSLLGHREDVMSVAYSGNGRRLATGSVDGTAKVWDAVSGKELVTIRRDGTKIMSVDLNGDGTRLAIGVDQGGNDTRAAAQIWDVNARRVLAALDADLVWVNQVVFDRNGTRVATAPYSGPFTAKIWDAASGRHLVTLSGHSGGVLAVAFSGDGKRIATGGFDSTARVWDAVNGRELFTLTTPLAIRAIAFSPDGARLAVAGDERIVRLYSMEPEQLVTLAATRLTRTLRSDECQRYLARNDCKGAPSSRFVDAKEMLTAGRTSDAIVGVRNGFDRHVAHPEAAARRYVASLQEQEARERARLGDIDGATAAIRSSLKVGRTVGPGPVARWVATSQVREAERLGAAGRWPDAIALLERAIRLDAGNERAHLVLARAFTSTREYGKAVAVMRKALGIRPSASNMVELANRLRLNKEYTEAVDYLTRAISVNPRDDYAHRILGLVFVDTKDPTKALDEFNAAIKIRPTEAAYMELADIYQSQKQFRLALETLEKAKEIDPDYAVPYRDAGVIYLEELFDFNAAYSELSAAHKLTPGDLGLTADFAEVCLAAGRFQEAIALADELLGSAVPLPSLSPSSRVAMRFVKIAASLLIGNTTQANAEQQALVTYLNTSPAFEQTWRYSGTRRFLRQHAMDEDTRRLLLGLLDTIDK